MRIGPLHLSIRLMLTASKVIGHAQILRIIRIVSPGEPDVSFSCELEFAATDSIRSVVVLITNSKHARIIGLEEPNGHWLQAHLLEACPIEHHVGIYGLWLLPNKD